MVALAYDDVLSIAPFTMVPLPIVILARAGHPTAGAPTGTYVLAMGVASIPTGSPMVVHSSSSPSVVPHYAAPR
jgi:hypothetical protein